MHNKLTHYLRAGYPGINIISYEEQRVELIIKSVVHTAMPTGWNLFAWSITDGVIEVPSSNDEAGKQHGANDVLEMFEFFLKMPEKSVLVLRDFHMFLREPNPIIFRKLKDCLLAGKLSNRTIIIVGCQLHLPPELEKEITVIEFSLPTKVQLGEILDAICESDRRKLLEGEERNAVLDATGGLTTVEAENAFALSIVEHKAIVPRVIAHEKAQTVKKNGIIEIVESNLSLDDVGGLDDLKPWLIKRRSAFSPEAESYGLPTPKGFLMFGVPGCGKSLVAKVTASCLDVPLLRLDAGKLFGSLVGESERNMRAVLQTAEAVAPCVLWIDEVEKGFSGSKSSGSTDGGTTARVFGSFLQWMQDKAAPVFVVATANDVSALPPEMLRKGRFDENWFIDLPTAEERKQIWEIQIKKRKRNPKKFGIAELARLTDGYTGSEIEQLFVESMFTAFDAGKEPSTDLLVECAKEFTPLSRMMAEDIKRLREWAAGRSRRASAPDAATTTIGTRGRKLG
ncbi:MAG: AAA family ATPase [Opitutaceae bacterium]|jgi:ATP-dependent 26S proteasome regulatory subunit|nr:AAA family ATPase [Opitutaceae bacterium]